MRGVHLFEQAVELAGGCTEVVTLTDASADREPVSNVQHVVNILEQVMKAVRRLDDPEATCIGHCDCTVCEVIAFDANDDLRTDA